MNAVFWIVIAAVAVLVVALLAGWAYARSRRRTALREQFGPEYDRTVKSAGSRRQAERELLEREKTHESLDIRPLSQYAFDAHPIGRSSGPVCEVTTKANRSRDRDAKPRVSFETAGPPKLTSSSTSTPRKSLLWHVLPACV